MNVRSEMILKGFLSRCEPARQQALMRFLPEEERMTLAELPTFEDEVDAESFTNSSTLERVHWSWLLPTLKSFSNKEQQLFLASLSPIVAENLREALAIKGAVEEISETARSFLREQLLHSLVGYEERNLPIDYLPASPLNKLLKLSKKQLIRLIDFLALHDLAAELRQIVETKILKKIYSFLTEEHKALLKEFSAQKEAHPLPRLGLDRWDGNEESLRTMLHRRGLARLALALSGQDPDLVWMLCHQLDIGRGNALYKLCAKEATPGVSSAIATQIEELLNRL